jgi:hypothetical protein
LGKKFIDPFKRVDGGFYELLNFIFYLSVKNTLKGRNGEIFEIVGERIFFVRFIGIFLRVT